MADYDEIIKQSLANVKALSDKIKDFDKLFQEIKTIKTATSKIPQDFQKKFDAIVNLSNQYTTDLGVATTNYLDGNNTLFSLGIDDLNTAIGHLKETFGLLQAAFLDQVKTDLGVVYKPPKYPDENYR